MLTFFTSSQIRPIRQKVFGRMPYNPDFRLLCSDLNGPMLFLLLLEWDHFFWGATTRVFRPSITIKHHLGIFNGYPSWYASEHIVRGLERQSKLRGERGNMEKEKLGRGEGERGKQEDGGREEGRGY